MSAYVYRRTEPGCYTVGFYNPDGHWYSESDHATSAAAADRVHWLNGEPIRPDITRHTVDAIREWITNAIETWTERAPIRDTPTVIAELTAFGRGRVAGLRFCLELLDEIEPAEHYRPPGPGEGGNHAATK